MTAGTDANAEDSAFSELGYVGAIAREDKHELTRVGFLPGALIEGYVAADANDLFVQRAGANAASVR